jgi:RimJ/RimL family protein N-acetyltransferase
MQRPRETLAHGPVTLHRWRAGAGPAAELAKAVTETQDELRPFMPWARGEYGLADAEEFLASCEQGWESGTEFNYAIRSSGELAGSIGLMARIGPGGLEIGYWVHRAWTSRGLATAATAALVDQAFRLPGVDRVEIIHDELNVPSGKIPRKLGFTEIERRPLDPPALGGTGFGVVWRLLKTDITNGVA